MDSTLLLEWGAITGCKACPQTLMSSCTNDLILGILIYAYLNNRTSDDKHRSPLEM